MVSYFKWKNYYIFVACHGYLHSSLKLRCFDVPALPSPFRQVKDGFVDGGETSSIWVNDILSDETD